MPHLLVTYTALLGTWERAAVDPMLMMSLSCRVAHYELEGNLTQQA